MQWRVNIVDLVKSFQTRIYYLLAKIGVDTAEIGPLTICQSRKKNIGRLLSGVGTGAVSVVVPIYIAETAPTRLRGTLGACNQLAVTIGILVVYMLGGYAFRTADGEYCDWRTLAFSFVAPIACLFVFAFLIPETPRWSRRAAG